MAAFWLLMNMLSSGFQCLSMQFRIYANTNAIPTIASDTHIHNAFSPFPNEAICLIGRMFQHSHIRPWNFMFYTSTYIHSVL